MENVNIDTLTLNADLAPSLDANVGPINGNASPSDNACNASACAAEGQFTATARFDAVNVTTFTRQYIEASSLEVRFDGTLSFKGDLLRADTPAEVATFLDMEQLTERDVLDRMVLFAFNEQYDFKKNLIESALRQELSRLRRSRYKAVMEPLLYNKHHVRSEEAQREWDRLGSLFDMEPVLAVAIVKHFFWQVKRKAINKAVTYHLMPIIFSPMQGTGKTFFLRKLVSPLQELASADALMSDLADRRSADIYRFPIVVLDDMEQITESAVPIIKSIVTSEQISRRKLQTSLTTTTRQKSTLIGTANRPVHELINDDTGHRRFVMLPFHNGNPSKGGQLEMWITVADLDYGLLWRSVDAFSKSPIEPLLAKLHSYQNSGRPIPPLLLWLRGLDLQAEKIKAISTRRGVRADALHELYEAETGNHISRQRFAVQMTAFMSEEGAPFCEKIRPKIGAIYVPKRAR